MGKTQKSLLVNCNLRCLWKTMWLNDRSITSIKFILTWKNNFPSLPSSHSHCHCVFVLILSWLNYQTHKNPSHAKSNNLYFRLKPNIKTKTWNLIWGHSGLLSARQIQWVWGEHELQYHDGHGVKEEKLKSIKVFQKY